MGKIRLGDAMGISEKELREIERDQKSNQWLEARILASARTIAKETALFRTSPELHEPDVGVRVYKQFVDINICLNGGQLALIPVHAKIPKLEGFTEELRVGIEKLAADLHLKVSTEPEPFGKSGPIGVAPPNVPGGWHAVLLRPEH